MAGVYSLFAPVAVPETDMSQHAEKILVEKGKRQLTVYSGGKVLASFKIGLGGAPEGHKQQKGDGRTPEGKYRISYKNPHSRYHLSLRVSYPNALDRENAKEKGVSPGSDIMIHGYPNYVPALAGDILLKGRDWTEGCVAVSNEEIEKLWQIISVGTEIEIKP